MGRVKDKMGLGFGCDPIRFFCHPLPPHPLPSFASSLQKREKELFSTTPSHQAMLRIEKTCNFKGFLDGEDGNDSECSSSCQSRWTIYLGQSQKSFDTLLPLQTEASVQGEKGEEEEEDDEEEEEDLSMLSDASSGPPNAPENADNCCSTGNFLPVAAVNKRGSKRRRVEEEEKEGQSSILDDTASSTLLSISKASNNRSYSSKRLLMEEDMEHSCGFSATHFGESNIQQQCLDYLHTSSALNPAPVCRHEAEKKLL